MRLADLLWKQVGFRRMPKAHRVQYHLAVKRQIGRKGLPRQSSSPRKGLGLVWKPLRLEGGNLLWVQLGFRRMPKAHRVQYCRGATWQGARTALRQQRVLKGCAYAHSD